MNIPYRLVVLDWEGTISDTLGPILNTINATAQSLGFGEFDLNQAIKYVELGLVAALKKLYPQLLDEQIEQLLQAVNENLSSQTRESGLIPGALDFIQRLDAAKIDIAVATNKGQHALARALHDTGLERYIKVTRCAGQVLPKPHPQMLQEIISVFGTAPQHTLMIGDSITDMQMASSIGVPAIGVDFYHQQGDALKQAGALAVFNDYQLLARFLNVT